MHLKGKQEAFEMNRKSHRICSLDLNWSWELRLHQCSKCIFFLIL